jgi:hypothetical protein
MGTKGQRLKAAATQMRRAKLMPHAERRRLIEMPFASTIHQHSSAWGGVFIKDTIPTEGRRVWVERPEDEEWMRNKWEEK